MDFPDSFKKRDPQYGNSVSDFEIILKNPNINIFLRGQSSFPGEPFREVKKLPAILPLNQKQGKNIKNIWTSFRRKMREKKVRNGIAGSNSGKNPINQCIHASIIETYHFKICIKICYLRKNL